MSASIVNQNTDEVGIENHILIMPKRGNSRVVECRGQYSTKTRFRAFLGIEAARRRYQSTRKV